MFWGLVKVSFLLFFPLLPFEFFKISFTFFMYQFMLQFQVQLRNELLVTHCDMFTNLVAGESGNGSDEMEKLYIHLKEASLSPIGDRKPSTKREFRASFVKRCKNHTVNDKLHLIRALNSTLKVRVWWFCIEPSQHILKAKMYWFYK